MSLSDLEVAAAAARAGAEVIRAGFGHPQQVELKGPVDLVTETDRAAEAAVIEVLERERPQDGIRAEEGTERPGSRTWVVDPIDGTTNFVHAVPHCCSTLALLDEGKITTGATANPFTDELFLAAQGEGAWLESGGQRHRLLVSGNTEFVNGLFATGFPYDREGPDYQRITSAWDKLSYISRATRRTGSAALDIAYVAAGRYDGYVVSGAKVWDIAAGIILVAEAGGRVSDLAGDRWDPGSNTCVVSNGVLHDALLELVSEG
ncbi:MAG: inositol monophosphatase [Candidatus Poseidoniia archaeon]|nr:inositol monophosphatase [Candidatus Poseidoniia archaeon]